MCLNICLCGAVLILHLRYEHHTIRHLLGHLTMFTQVTLLNGTKEEGGGGGVGS